MESRKHSIYAGWRFREAIIIDTEDYKEAYGTIPVSASLRSARSVRPPDAPRPSQRDSKGSRKRQPKSP